MVFHQNLLSSWFERNTVTKKKKKKKKKKKMQNQVIHSSIYRTHVFFICTCTTIHRYPIFSTRYSVMCKVYTGYCGTSEIKYGLCASTVDNPLAKARGLSPYRRTNHALSLTCTKVHGSVLKRISLSLTCTKVHGSILKRVSLSLKD